MTRTTTRDLLVAGGGPAGLATALYAARAGLNVVVREPRAGAIDKACGEGLMPGALAALLDLKVDPAGHELQGVRYLAPGQAAASGFRDGPGRGVRRTVLHEALTEAVADAGVPVEPRAVGALRQDEDGVVVDGERFRFAVAADGLHSPLRRQLGLDRGPGRLRRFGLRRHFALPAWSSYVEVHWGPHTEAYVTPVAPDLVGVAVLTARPGAYDDHLAQFPALRERLAGAAAGDLRGAGPLHQRVSARVAGRVLLVGDAAGYVDALTGEGIALGVAQARAAVDAVAAGDPGSYGAAWPALTRRYRWLTAGLVQATRVGAVRRAVVPGAQRLPRVFDAAVATLAAPA